MKNLDKRRYEMLMRVRTFGTTYGQLFPEASLAQPTFAALASALDRIQAQQVAANTATVSASAARTSSAREVLLEQLTKIAATARVISETNADLGAHFKLADASNSQLLTTARGFLENAAPFADAFVAHGMVPTFLENLRASIDTFDRARRDRGTGADQRLTARASFHMAMADARAALRKLDVIVANHAGLDPAIREAWEQDRRVAAPRPAKKKKDEPVAEEKKAEPVGAEEKQAA